MKENQMNSLDKMEEDRMREAFKQWHFHFDFGTEIDGSKEAWDAAIKYANSQHSKVLEDYDRLAKLAQGQAEEIAELSRLKNHFQKNYEDTNKLNWDLGLRLSAANANIAMLATELENCLKVMQPTDRPGSAVYASRNAQAASDAFMAEHDAKVLEEAKKQWWKDLHYAEPEILEVMRQCEEDEIKFSKVAAWGALVDAAKKASTRASANRKDE